MANIKANALAVVLIILLTISICLAGIAFYSLQKEQAKTLALQQDLEELKIQHKIVEKKLQDSQNSVAALETQLRDNDSLITELKTELEAKKNESEKIINEKEKIQFDLEQQKKLRSELEDRYIKLLEQSKKAQQQIEELTAQKNELEKKLKDMESKAEGIELGKIVIGPENKEIVQAEEFIEENPLIVKQQEEQVKIPQEELRLEGRVLVVNKEYGFAVIDMGGNEGVKLGDIFFVYQNKKHIGDLKIEKVHESMSAAGFMNNKVKDKINEGDTVVLKK